ncbi:protein ARABIDILLO 1-like isoform X1 [Phoenix dactylifera]|uniref:Protein ARABIDILLO 1-like isoform X1 n=1 Tax=Phoenix dactylifera TaxID=42345 RepID=A0A8B7BVL6_PHODC|nr:protein ARABIDILLO 1-like isoform X1 [Phoenix dactylifera]
MSRRVRRRGVQSKDKEKVVISPVFPEAAEDCEILRPGGGGGGGDGAGVAAVDWTCLADDTVVQLFSCLNYRDRASLASTCRTWRLLGSSPCLWTALDLRAHRCGPDTAAALAGRCSHLRRLRFRGADAAAAVMNLQARGLQEIAGDYCRDITDATLSVIAARHEALESLQIGPDPCERITSDAIRHVAMCCTRLRRLRLSGIREVDGEAVGAFARHCPQLDEIAFLDCGSIDESALGKVVSLRFLSVAGSRNLKWATASLAWSKLPNLIGLDVSRTDVSPSAVSRLISLSKSLKVLCALNCVALEEEVNHNPAAFTNTKGKVLLGLFSDIFKGIASLFKGTVVKERGIFGEWRSWENKDKNLNDIMIWIEWILSQSLLRIAETNPHGIDEFWLRQGAALLLSLVKSSQADVQERAATGLATFVVIDDDNAAVDPARAEAVMRNGGIPLLLELAKSCREGIQSEAAKAIANLSVNTKVAKAVADEGGISILADLARSMNRLVAEEAAGGLWNLSVGEEHKAAIAEAGGVKALVDLIFKWYSGIDGVLERAAGALANLAADDKCSLEVAVAGGVQALVMLARWCKVEGVQEQAARALANLAAHGDSNSNNAAVGQEAGALEALVQLTCSQNEGVRQEAAGALWNLSFDDRNREAIAAAGGVEALVGLAQGCSNASQGLQERAAGALWGLSVSEANSIAIGREGGVAPLITLARSDAEDVHETAAGALWNLAFNSGNALRIVEEGGVPALVHLCASSGSKMARFMAALALAYMFDGRMDEVALVGSSLEGASKSVNFDGARRMALKHIEAFVLTFSEPQLFSMAAASSAPAALAQIAEAARIQEAGHLRCSRAEIGRFVAMLRNPSSILRACAAFALLQFTIPGGRHAVHHAGLLQKAGAARVLRAAAAAATAPIEAKIFARIVLRNLEHHQLEASI